MPPPVTWLSACTASGQLLEQSQQRRRVEPGRLEQHLADQAAELVRAVGVADVAPGEDVAHQREAVAVQPGRRERDHDVAVLARARAPSSGIRLDRADGGTGDVVVVRPEQPGMLGGLAADERGAGRRRRRGRCRATMSAMRSGTTLPQAM